jgi:DNA replication protein DnaC
MDMSGAIFNSYCPGCGESGTGIRVWCDKHAESETAKHNATEAKRHKEFLKSKRFECARALRADLPREFKTVDLKNLPVENQALITAWLSDSQDWCLFFQGSVGTGKSYSAYSALIYAAENLDSYGQHTSVFHFSAMDLVAFLQEDYRQEEPKNFKALCDCDYLLIDDLGTERSTEDAIFQIMRVIYHRHSEIKKTIITTNEKIAALASKFHPRLTSRVMSGTPIHLKGDDWRLKK